MPPSAESLPDSALFEAPQDVASTRANKNQNSPERMTRIPAVHSNDRAGGKTRYFPPDQSPDGPMSDKRVAIPSPYFTPCWVLRNSPCERLVTPYAPFLK